MMPGMKGTGRLAGRLLFLLLILVDASEWALASSNSTSNGAQQRKSIRICASYFQKDHPTLSQDDDLDDPLSDAQISCFDRRSSQKHAMAPMPFTSSASSNDMEMMENTTCTTLYHVPKDTCEAENNQECHSMEESTFSWWEPLMNQFVSTNHLQCIIEKPGIHPTKVLAQQSFMTSSSSSFPLTRPDPIPVAVQLFPDRRCDFHNGCGAEYWPPAMRTALDAATGFMDECNYHDCCYHECSETRASCDHQFLVLMEQQCHHLYAPQQQEQHHHYHSSSSSSTTFALWNTFRQWTCMSLAHAMYLAVEVLGQSAYDEAQQQSQCPGT